MDNEIYQLVKLNRDNSKIEKLKILAKLMYGECLEQLTITRMEDTMQ